MKEQGANISGHPLRPPKDALNGGSPRPPITQSPDHTLQHNPSQSSHTGSQAKGRGTRKGGEGRKQEEEIKEGKCGDEGERGERRKQDKEIDEGKYGELGKWERKGNRWMTMRRVNVDRREEAE